MDDEHAGTDRGFTLIEIAVAVAIIATTVAAGVGISLASRSFAVSAAAAEFDHLLDSARTIARETQGATLVFAPDAYGDGTEVRILAPGSNNTLVATTMPIMHTHAAIEEAQSLGKAPFALVVHASGALGGRPGYHLGDSTATGEVGCPASGSFHFMIHTAGTTADRFLPCRITLAATGPIMLASWPPATVAPLPTPCTSGACAPTVLPTPPSSNPSCPPNYTPTPGGCALPPPASAPRYHVSGSLASVTMSIGGSDDSIVAAANLVNANAVAPGTPPSLPVLIQRSTDLICTATPRGPQPTGTTFTLKSVSPGTCTITVGADPSAVPGATADQITFNVPVGAAVPSPAPTPVSCDLSANGKCYHRIVQSTSKTFEKFVAPDIACGDRGDGPTCWYVDSIKDVTLLDEYSFLPPIPPTTASQELLFRIDQITGLTYGCAAYASFAAVPVFNTITWSSTGISGPVDPPPGFGDPATFMRVNIVYSGSASPGVLDETVNTKKVVATLNSMIDAIAFRNPGSEFMFTYSSPEARSDSYITWLPDFPGCDNFGEINGTSTQYGYVSPQIRFEIYQAVAP